MTKEKLENIREEIRIKEREQRIFYLLEKGGITQKQADELLIRGIKPSYILNKKSREKKMARKKLKEIKETSDIGRFVSFIIESYERPIKEKAKIGKRLVRVSDNLVSRYRMNSKYNFKADLFETMRDNGKEINVARLVYDYFKEHTDKETSEEYVRNQLTCIQKELCRRNPALESKLYVSGNILEIASHEK